MLEIFFNNFCEFSEIFFRRLSDAQDTEKLFSRFYQEQDGTFFLSFRKRGTDCKIIGKIVENVVFVDQIESFYPNAFIELIISLFREEIKKYVYNVSLGSILFNDLLEKKIITENMRINGDKALSVYSIYKHYDSLKKGIIYKTQCPNLKLDDKIEYENLDSD